MKNRIFAIALIVVLAVASLTGCGKKQVGDITVGAGESAVYIQENGKVSYAIGEAFDQDYYDKKELKNLIKEEIKTFNEDKHSAKLNSYWVENKLVTAIMTFSSIDEYLDYVYDCNGVAKEDFFIGGISDALANDYEIVGEFTKVEDGALSQDTALSSDIKNMAFDIVILKTPAKFQVENGDIKYVSSNCKVDNNIVTVGDDLCSNADGEQECTYIIYSQN